MPETGAKNRAGKFLPFSPAGNSPRQKWKRYFSCRKGDLLGSKPNRYILFVVPPFCLKHLLFNATTPNAVNNNMIKTKACFFYLRWKFKIVTIT